MKLRAVGFFTLIFLLIGLICLSAYALTKPNAIKKAIVATSTNFALMSQISTATQIVQDQINEESTKVALVATQTQQAAEISQTQTQTSLPPTFTAVPTQSSCRAVTDTAQFLYLTPNDALPSVRLTSGTELEVTGKLDDSDWYQVRSGSDIGWLPNNILGGLDTNCPTVLGVGNAVGIEGVSLLDDTFREGKGWYYSSDSQIRVERNIGTFNDFQLQVDGYFKETVITTKSLENISTFDLVTSFYRQNATQQSYVGVRFGDANSSFVVYIYGDCSIEVKSSAGVDEIQPSSSSNNLCRDQSSDYLRTQWDGNQLLVWINDKLLSNRFFPGVSPIKGNIELMINGAKAQILYVVVTEQ